MSRLEDLRIGQRVTVVGEYAGEWRGQVPEICGLVRHWHGRERNRWKDDVWLKDADGCTYDGFVPKDLEVYHGVLPEDRS